MEQDTVFIVKIEGISADVIPLLHEQYGLTEARGDSLGQGASRETGSND
jgi:hypothetical protein